MKITIKVEKEVEIKTLLISACVRYWEGSKVNGKEDSEDGDLMPCKIGDSWQPLVDISNGQILNWEIGKTASIYYKVCDAGCYYLKDENECNIISKENEYVPDCLAINDSGYGDYIIMEISELGFIQDWNFDIDNFIDDED